MKPGLALAVVLAGAALMAGQGWRQGASWALGAGFGAVLLLSAFSFAGTFRRFLGTGRGAGIRAQMLLLALTTALILPLLGGELRGLVFSPGLAVAVGALVFGVGMQLGGGCASGTLYAAGGGNARMALTLLCFIAGATLAAWQSELWANWPAPPPLALAERFGTAPVLAASLAIFALVAWATRAWECRLHGSAEPIPRPLLLGAATLAGLNLLTLLVVGRPWAITAAFPLWGAKLIAALGLDEPAFWPFWEDPTRIEALLRPLAADRTTAMDFGLLAGAALAAFWAGQAPRWRIAAGEAAASVLGGLLLGLGAVMASGCNISAYLGGIASGSLHGWLWIGPALLGNAIGMRLRPAFGISRN